MCRDELIWHFSPLWGGEVDFYYQIEWDRIGC